MNKLKEILLSYYLKMRGTQFYLCRVQHDTLHYTTRLPLEILVTVRRTQNLTLPPSDPRTQTQYGGRNKNSDYTTVHISVSALRPL